MKFQELYDYDDTSSKTNQRKLFGRNLTKVKNLLLIVGFLLICSGFYWVERKSVDHKMTKLEDQVGAIQSLLKDIKIDSHVSKRNVETLNHMNKRSAEDGDDKLDNISSSSRGGATYIRWGSRNCEGPEHTKLVYEGEAAGTENDKTGGGSNVICIDLNVSYTPGKYLDGNQGSSYIHGMEYFFSSTFNRFFDFSRTEANSVHSYNVPCAACMATGKVNQLMIPGRETCPPHWTKEYTGYIMSGHPGQKSTEPYLCIDDKPQVVPGSDTRHSDGVLYMVETQCPSLQCQPFVQGRELRCVVCTI